MMELFTESLDPDHSVGEFLLICVIAASTASGLSLLIARRLEQRPALRHAVLLAGLVCTGLTPLLTACSWIAQSPLLSITVPILFSSKPPTQFAEATTRETPINNSDAPFRQNEFEGERPHPFEVARTELTASSNESAAAVGRTEVAQVSSVRYRLAETTLCSIWLAGSLLVLIRFGRSSIQVAKIRRSSRPLPDEFGGFVCEQVKRVMKLGTLPEIRVSPHVDSPVVTGILYPQVLLPESLLSKLSDEELREILIHETAHVIRRDLWVVHLEALTIMTAWPIPFVHRLVQELSSAREELCDLHVVKTCERHTYGRTLLRVARGLSGGRPTPLMICIAQAPGRLERRIANLLNGNRDETIRLSALQMSGVLAALLLLTGVLCGTRLLAGNVQQVDVPPQPSVENERSAGEDLAETEISKTIAKIELLGGTVERDNTRPGSPVIGASWAGCQRMSDKYLHLLTPFTTLSSLDLGQTPITDEGLKLLRGLKSLTTLRLNWTDISDAGLEELTELENLKELNLWDNVQITDEGIKHVAKLKNLVSLDLSHTKVTDEGLKELRGLKQLESLILWGTQITGEGLKELNVLTNLKSLNFSGTAIASEGLRELRDLKNLTSLNLLACKITDDDLKELKNFPNLNQLNLGANPITDRGLKELRGLTNVTDLFLGLTKITDAGMHELSEFKKLTSLSFFQTEISDAGLKTLREHQVLENLSTLDISSEVTDAGLRELEGIKSLKTLTLYGANITGAGLTILNDLNLLEDLVKLELGYSQVTDSGLKQLRGLKHLKSLGLTHTSVSDVGLKELAELENLSSLYLSKDNKNPQGRITDAGLKELTKFPNLSYVGLGGTEVTDAGLKELMKLPRLSSIGLGRTDVTDAGLKELSRCPQLVTIALQDTRVTAPGLVELNRLKKLRMLYVSDSEVSKAELTSLKGSLPNVRILVSVTDRPRQ